MTRRSQRLADLGFASYEAYLRSDLWASAKQRYRESGLPQTCQAIIADGKRCEIPTVELHHWTYRKLGREPASHLVPLCRGHHQALHGQYVHSLADGPLRAATKRLCGSDGPWAKQKPSKRSQPWIGLAYKQRHLDGKRRNREHNARQKRAA